MCPNPGPRIDHILLIHSSVDGKLQNSGGLKAVHTSFMFENALFFFIGHYLYTDCKGAEISASMHGPRISVVGPSAEPSPNQTLDQGDGRVHHPSEILRIYS